MFTCPFSLNRYIVLVIKTTHFASETKREDLCLGTAQFSIFVTAKKLGYMVDACRTRCQYRKIELRENGLLNNIASAYFGVELTSADRENAAKTFLF